MITRSSKGASLRREDWDFTKVPDAELETCLRWECFREWSPTDVAIDEWEGNSEIPGWTEVREMDDYTGLLAPEMLIGKIVWLDTPWKLLPEEIRWHCIQHYSPPLVEVDDPDPRLIEHDRKQCRGNGYNLVAFQIYWDAHDSRIIEKFAQWLAQNRKDKPVERRGRSDRDMLKMIGAMRLLHEMTLDEAISVTRQALGKPLYGKRPSWDRARRGGVDAIIDTVVYDSMVLEEGDEKELIRSYKKFSPPKNLALGKKP